MSGGRRMLMACAIALALIAAPSSAHASGEYRTVEIESLRITVDAEWIPSAAPGYLPVRWDITNLGGDRTIEIFGTGTRMFTGGGSFPRGGPSFRQGRPSVRQRLQIRAGDRVRFTMPVPASGDTDNMSFVIREDNRIISQIGVVSVSRYSDVAAVIVAAQNGAYAALAPGWMRYSLSRGRFFPGRVIGAPGTVVTPGSSTTTPPSGPPLDIVLEPARLPTSWLAYTSVKAVVVGGREWESMDAGQRAALLTWTACGGNLILVDADIDTLFPDVKQRPIVSGGVARHFFGKVHLLPSAKIESVGLTDTLDAIDSAAVKPWQLPLEPISSTTGVRGFRIPIPGVNAIPARIYLTILALFAVVIGPINHIVLRRRRQQALVVLTTPLIATLFIVLLAGYVVVVEGFGVRGRVISFTVLDQGSGHAATRAAVSLYAAGRAPSGGLRFARDVAVFSTPLENTAIPAETLDLSELQQFSSGFLQARTPTNFETLGYRAARERLVFSREGGHIRVSNGLGSTVTRLRFRQGEQSYSLGESLQSGGSAVLRETCTRRLSPSGRHPRSQCEARVAPWTTRREMVGTRHRIPTSRVLG